MNTEPNIELRSEEARKILRRWPSKKATTVSFMLLLFWPVALFSQGDLTLENCIKLAQKNSLEAKQAQYDFADAYYQYKLYRKSLLPTLSLSGSLPAFNRSISKITLPDGSESFVAQSTGNYSANVQLNQVIPFTGGQFYVSSGLQRLDVFLDNRTTSYLANYVNVGIRQPLVTYNSYKWQRKIEPLAYSEAKRVYAEALEKVALQTVEHYFALLEAQITLQLKQQNLADNDTLFAIAKEKYALGKITEDQLIEVEISCLNLAVEIEELQNEMEDKWAALSNYLGISEQERVEISIPNRINDDFIDFEKAYYEAIENGSVGLTQRRKIVEAQSDVARAKADNGFSLDLNASFGLSKSDDVFRTLYRNPLDQEQITLTFNIPILEWGMAKCRRKRAEIALLSVQNSVEQEKLDFRRTLISMVNQYNRQASQLRLVEKSTELSAIRFAMSKERYATGKIGFLDYSVAQNEKDNAQLEYVRVLQKNWTKFYEIRQTTLYDFVKNRKIEIEYFQQDR